MVYPILIVSICRGKSIRIQRVKDKKKNRRWIQCNAARINELKYSSSMNILKTMYGRQLQGDPTYE